MNNEFIYSILKYNHSQLLGEALNVGVLFSFDEGKQIRFVAGNAQRVKSVYPGFDIGSFQTLVKGIKRKLDSGTSPFSLFSGQFSFQEYVQIVLLPEDSTALQFTEPFSAINPFSDYDKTIAEFSRLLLPETEIKKEEDRHNESYILKTYTEYISKRNINVDFRMRKNHPIQIKGLKMNFELSWKNGTVHLIKPISFDLKLESDIQIKSAQYFGYFDLMTDHAKRNDYTFDLLVAKPQDDKLHSSYEDALYILDRAHAPKAIITEEKLVEYSEETAEILHKKDSSDQ